MEIKNKQNGRRKKKHSAEKANLHLHSLNRIAQLLQSLFPEKYYVQEVLNDNSKHWILTSCSRTRVSLHITIAWTLKVTVRCYQRRTLYKLNLTITYFYVFITDIFLKKDNKHHLFLPHFSIYLFYSTSLVFTHYSVLFSQSAFSSEIDNNYMRK